MTRHYPSNTWIISIPFTHQSAKLVPYVVILACLSPKNAMQKCHQDNVLHESIIPNIGSHLFCGITY